MVTERDKLVRAQQYIAKLAEGIDPIADQKLPADTVLNNPRLSRCFLYVAEVLSSIIEGHGNLPAEALAPFSITGEELRRVAVAEEPVTLTTLLKAVGDATPGRKKLAAAAVTGWLVREGYLKSNVGADGKSRKEVTPKGKAIGLYTEMRDGPSGRYLAVFYKPEAQRQVLAHIHEIAASAGK